MAAGTLLVALTMSGTSIAAALTGTHLPVLTPMGEALVGVVPGGADLLALASTPEQGWREVDLADVEVVARNDDGTEHPGRGGNCLGDPRLALTWLVNELSSAGLPLLAGTGDDS